MNAPKYLDCLSLGLAIFAMFFGAGNIIFPLALGQMALDQTPWGLLGLLLTAPRCIALAHSTLSLSLPGTPLMLFSACACALIFLLVCRENRLLKWLGYVLSPLKIAFLVLIIVKGFLEAPEATLVAADLSRLSHFWHGLTEGYNTMDLLAAFFFAPIIVSSVSAQEGDASMDRYLQGIPSEQLLGSIALQILGPYAGLVVSITVSFACLTTAIALLAAFTSYVHKEVCRDRIGYPTLIALTFINLFAPMESIAKESKSA